MRFFVVIGLAALSAACVTASSFKAPDGRPAFAIKCNGGMRSMASCYNEAEKRCPGGYDVIDRSQSTGVVGTPNGIVPARFRDLEVACKVPPKG